MITEHTHSENNDWQGPGGEQLSASETSTPQPAENAPAQEEGQFPEASTPAAETLVVAGEEVAAAAKDAEQLARAEESVVEQHVDASSVENAPVTLASVVADEVERDLHQQILPMSESANVFPLESEASAAELAMRPFTEFIEEFRQNEGHFGPLPDTSFTAFVTNTDGLQEPFPSVEGGPELEANLPLFHLDPATLAAEIAAPVEVQPAPSGQVDELPPGITQPRLSPERPVSPLLRPATRPRVPRHGRHRIDELIHPAELRGDMLRAPAPASTPASAPVVEPVNTVEAATEPKADEQGARPARRYRFDRPTSAASATPKTPATPKTAAPVRAGESKAQRGFAARGENVASVDASAAGSPVLEALVVKASVEAPAPVVETPAPVAPVSDRRRRGSHDKSREKEQQAVAPVVAPEPVAPVIEPVTVVEDDEVALEDLPPLEYSDLQAANSRRRRRRRPGSPAVSAVTPGAAAAPAPAPAPRNTLADLIAPPAPAAAAPTQAPRGVPNLAPESYSITSGQTVRQMNQGNDMSGPFMGPEPSPARGSTFTPSVRPLRGEALRHTPTHTPKHGESPTMSGASVNHLANVVSQAMQTQTDRMVAEMRRANQVPTNVSVSLPPFPSTERVGVFVDVANLLYSARTLRIAVDFGKLLDFLRGNRRLVRAQAYCPTSPQPGDDQMFLQAVKGLGYRITTKNYKTFSSGAKKADLDLDLCMDVVRLVDGKAVDCIVLVSGDSDFMPMLDYCSDHGVRVEVAAFDESMSATLRQSCDLFVNLSMLEEIRL